MTTSGTRSEGEPVSEIQTLSNRVQWLSSSVDTWNDRMIWALVVAAIGALFVVWTTRKVVVRSKELAATQSLLSDAKDRKALADSKDKDEHIANALKTAGQAQASLALAEQHAAEANEKAEAFRLDIAKANQSAKEADARAAEANLALAKLKTPRTLSTEQQQLISSRAQLFPGIPYDLWVSADSDSTTLMELIDQSLRTAKWKFQTAGVIQYDGKAGIIAEAGISIHFALGKESTLEQPALVLGNAFAEAGLQVKGVYRDTGEANKEKDQNSIHVFVGSKPMN